MANNRVPIYESSRSIAKRDNELKEYALSLSENIRCAQFIEETINSNFNGFKLKKDSAKQIIAEFGFDRTNFIVANSVQKKIGEKRIDKECRKWASSFYIPRDMVAGENVANQYAVNSDAGLINIIAKQVQREYDSLNLIKYEQCNDPTHVDYTNKIMILDPKWLYDEFRTPENQIIKCWGGFGCSPTASGRKIFGRYMIDDQDCSFDRSDLIGELKEENYPKWLQDKLIDEQRIRDMVENQKNSIKYD
ncbi:MAG: DUF3849 domain-containing protein [Clostridia bacterium]